METMANQYSHPKPDLGYDSVPQRPPTTQEAVLETLRHAIASGALPPGERLYQDALAHQMGVSRVPVREALNVLRADGQLEYSPHRGYRVSTLSREEVHEINLIRELLEAEAIRRAIPAIDDDFVDHLKMLNKAMSEANKEGDVAGFISLNYDFHFALFGLAGLPRLRKYIDALWKSADPYRRAVFSSAEARAHMLVEHENLIEACEARDTVAATRIMQEHRNKALKALSTIVDDEDTLLVDSAI